MILSENVEMLLSNRTYKRLLNMYNLSKEYKIGDVVKIPISILSKSSHYEIDITCDYCGKELKVPYKRYNLNTKVVNKYACTSKECSNKKIKDVCQVKYGVDNPFQAEFVKEKSKETIKEKWGVEHQMHVDEVKDKIKKTCLEKYGVDSYTKTDEYLEKTKNTNLEKYGVEHTTKTIEGVEKRKKTRIKNGNQLPDSEIEPFKLYRRLIDNKLDRMRKSFLEKWDGFDFYDGEYIRDNFNLPSNDRLYPSIDHKISVYYGFINKINWEDIADESNLCVTKSHINSSKCNLNYYEFNITKKEDI